MCTLSASLLGFNLELCSLQNAWFRKSRFKGGKGKKLNIGGGGLGYRERPGLGSENSVSPSYSSTLGIGLCTVLIRVSVVLFHNETAMGEACVCLAD